MLDTSGTDGDWVPRGTLVRMAPRILCYLREYREDPVAWVFLAAGGWSAPPSIWDYCFRSSAMQHPREGLNPGFSLGGSLSHEYCRASAGLSCSENLVLMVASNGSSDTDQDGSAINSTAREYLCG